MQRWYFEMVLAPYFEMGMTSYFEIVTASCFKLVIVSYLKMCIMQTIFLLGWDAFDVQCVCVCRCVCARMCVCECVCECERARVWDYLCFFPGKMLKALLGLHSLLFNVYNTMTYSFVLSNSTSEQRHKQRDWQKEKDKIIGCLRTLT